MADASVRRWRSSIPEMARSSTVRTRSPGRSPARAAGTSGDHFHDLDPARVAGLPRDPRCGGTRTADDAEVGAPNAALAHEGRDDRSRGGVDRDGEADSLAHAHADQRGVDADDPGGAVRERAARVARMKRGVGLDDVLDDPRCRSRSGGQRSPQRAHHPGGHRTLESERAADRDDELTDPERRGVAERRGHQIRRTRAHDREVRQGIGSDDLEREPATVGEHRAAAAKAGDHVSGRNDVAVRGDRHPAAASIHRAPGRPAPHLEAGNRRRQQVDDLRDDGGVGVERLRFRGDTQDRPLFIVSVRLEQVRA